MLFENGYRLFTIPYIKSKCSETNSHGTHIKKGLYYNTFGVPRYLYILRKIELITSEDNEKPHKKIYLMFENIGAYTFFAIPFYYVSIDFFAYIAR